MAHLWVRDDDDQWAALPLNGGPVSLSMVPPKPFGGGERPRPDREVLLMPAARSGQENWVLVSGDQRRTSVNGLPLALGLRILGDRDEIRVDGASTVFFCSGVRRAGSTARISATSDGSCVRLMAAGSSLNSRANRPSAASPPA